MVRGTHIEEALGKYPTLRLFSNSKQATTLAHRLQKPRHSPFIPQVYIKTVQHHGHPLCYKTAIPVIRGAGYVQPAALRNMTCSGCMLYLDNGWWQKAMYSRMKCRHCILTGRRICQEVSQNRNKLNGSECRVPFCAQGG